MKKIRIGTRGSALALWQANHIKERLKELHGVEQSRLEQRERYKRGIAVQVECVGRQHNYHRQP